MYIVLVQGFRDTMRVAINFIESNEHKIRASLGEEAKQSVICNSCSHVHELCLSLTCVLCLALLLHSPCC